MHPAHAAAAGDDARGAHPVAALPSKQLSDCICAKPLVDCAHGGVAAPTHLCEIYENKAYAWKASEAGLEERCCRASALRCDMVCGPWCMQLSMVTLCVPCQWGVVCPGPNL